MASVSATGGVPGLLFRAFEEARGLDHGWVGTEHLLLALLAKPSVATDVLAELGLTYERLATHLRTSRGDPDWPSPRYNPEEGLTGPTPAGHALVGWTRGLARAWGHTEPSPEHWLLAMVYDAGSIPSLLHFFGVTQESVLDELRSRGVRMPDVYPPRYKPWRGHREARVTSDELDSVLRLLRLSHSPGSEWRWGFNWLPGEPKRARVDCEDGIDLDAIVRKVRSGKEES